jgi:hypothetical protein
MLQFEFHSAVTGSIRAARKAGTTPALVPAAEPTEQADEGCLEQL